MGFGYFAVIPYPVLASKELSGNEKILYGLISVRLTTPGYCSVQNKELCKFFDVDEKTISSWIANLKKNDFIRVVQNNRKHRRQIYLREFPVPPGEEEPQKFSEKQQMFVDAFPDRLVDMNEIPDFVDMPLLIKFVKSSKWLSEHKECSLSWLVKRYKEILNGKYKNYKRKGKASTERDYTRDEMNALYQNPEEVEI